MKFKLISKDLVYNMKVLFNKTQNNKLFYKLDIWWKDMNE